MLFSISRKCDYGNTSPVGVDRELLSYGFNELDGFYKIITFDGAGFVDDKAEIQIAIVGVDAMGK